MIPLLILAAALTLQTHPLAELSTDQIRRELNALYQRAGAAYVAARTIDDMEAARDWLDTPDCRYRDYGQPFRTWAGMRPFVIMGLQTPIKAFSTHIDKIDVDVPTNTVITTTTVKGVAHLIDAEGRFGARGAAHDVETTATILDTWVRTSSQWRRKVHDKIAPNVVTAIDGKAALR